MLLCVILKYEIGVVETNHPVGGHKGKSHQGIVEEGEPEKFHRNQAISRMSGQLLFAFLQPSASLKASLVFASFIRTNKKDIRSYNRILDHLS